MKKIYLLSFAALSALGVNAQRNFSESRMKVFGSVEKTIKPVKHQEASTKAVIWSNDFSTPSQWVITNATNDFQDWVITNASNTTMGYSTGSWVETALTVSNENGFALFDSDFVGADGGSQDANITFASTIDLTGHPNVVIEFNQRGRMWSVDDVRTQTNVQISTNGGTTWTTFPVNADKPLSITFEEKAFVNITSAAGNQANVKLRFNYKGSWDYAWMIDDVKIIDQKADEIINIGPVFVGTNNEGIEYGRTPIDQLDASYEVGGQIVNFGVNTQNNINVTADFGSFNVPMTVGAILSGDTATYFSTQTPALSIGQYNGTYTASSPNDSIGGAEALNNVTKRNFAVTSNMYSTDGIGIHPTENLLVTSNGSDSWGEPQNTYLANYYSLKATTNLISGFEIGLASSSQPGATLQISIVDTTTFFENATTYIQSDNNGNPAESGEIVITAADITAGKIGIAFPQPISLPAGSYMAVVKTSSTLGNRVRVLDDLTVPQPGVASMINTINDAGVPQTFGGNGNAYAIRLKMGDQMSVDELASTFGLSVYPNPASADATVAFDVKNAASVAIQVTDLAGKVVYTSALANVNGAQNVVIPAQEFANGMYTVSINVDGAIATKKLNIRK
jgi:hypothetical protein